MKNENLYLPSCYSRMYSDGIYRVFFLYVFEYVAEDVTLFL